MRIIPVFFVLALVLLTSCAPQVPFTQRVREQYKLTAEELQSLQFYTSGDIILRKGEQNIKEKATGDGTLMVREGKKVEEVIIPAGTPCVVTKVIDGYRLALQFGEGPKEYLVFGVTKGRNGYYRLQALEWEQNQGKLQYGNRYYVTQPGAGEVILLFKMKGNRILQQQRTIVNGQRL